jgi:hypothetical protein
MRAAAVVTGVLGAGTAFVFAAAAVVSALFPSGSLVQSGWNGGCFDCGGGWAKPGIGVPVPMPMPVPGIQGIPEKGVVILQSTGTAVDVAPAMPAGTADDVIPQP